MRPIRLRHAWQWWPKGHVFTEMPAAAAQAMVQAGQAEYADAAAAPAPAPPAGYVDRQMRPARRARQ